MESNENNSLYHHGILGQKWGVRRYQNKDGSLTRWGSLHIKDLQKKSDDSDYTYSPSKRQLKKMNKAKSKEYDDASKNRKLLTDEDLNTRINRLRQERELKRLTEESEHPIRTRVKYVMTSAGTAVLSNVAKKTMEYGLKSIMKHEKMSFKNASDYIFQRGGKKKKNNRSDDDDD